MSDPNPSPQVVSDAVVLASGHIVYLTVAIPQSAADAIPDEEAVLFTFYVPTGGGTANKVLATGNGNAFPVDVEFQEYQGAYQGGVLQFVIETPDQPPSNAPYPIEYRLVQKLTTAQGAGTSDQGIASAIKIS